MTDLKEIREKLHDEILLKIDLSREVTDEEMEDIINECILNETAERYIPLKDKIALRTELFDSIRKKGVIQQLIDDPQVTDELRFNMIQCINIKILQLA